jgi:hypothetical protein
MLIKQFYGAHTNQNYINLKILLNSKKRMNRKTLVYVVFFLLVLTLAFADTQLTAYSCSTDENCVEQCDLDYGLNMSCYCSGGFCYLPDTNSSTNSGNISGTSNLTNATNLSSNTQVQTVVSSVATKDDLKLLEQDISTLTTDVVSLEGDISSLDSKIVGINTKLSQLTTKTTGLGSELDTIKQELKLEISSVATGLAGLQGTVQETQSELGSLEENVAEKPGTSRIVLYVFIILIIIAIGVGAFYILEKTRHSGEDLGQEIVNYITTHIKGGKKYHHIKQNLLDAGWNHDQINSAYRKTSRQNYQKYRTQTNSTPSKNKLIIIGVLSLFLVLGVTLFLTSSTGQAFFASQQINENTREVTNVVDCTLPHILSPGGDSCCLDLDANDVCDIYDREVEQNTGSCTDNLQCAIGQLCIDSECKSLNDLYKGSANCKKLCNYYSVNVRSSDDKKAYQVAPNKGSYTSAGAVEWRVLELPDHCNGERAIIPIDIIRKNKGKIIGEQVITLQEGDTSSQITHSQLPSVGFKLSVDKVFELCEEI